ncbi:MAG: ATP-grasp domain-containing protein [Candidatus Omnitrophota bacterium]
MYTKHVLILDGFTKHSLAFVRSLGRQGVRITLGSPVKYTSLSFYSKFVNGFFRYPEPESNPEGFVAALLEEVKKSRYDAIFPLRDATTYLVSRHKKAFLAHTNAVVADFEQMEIAADKSKTISFVQGLGVAIPATRIISEKELLNLSESDFPAVLKLPMKSGGVRYVNSMNELTSAYRQLRSEKSVLSGRPVLLQEYIPGEGYGYFALCDRGRVLANFMHKRIREYPVTGGISTAAESIYDERLKSIGELILKKLPWSGVIMMEFKRDARDDTFKLMELNPKFWGSLDLAIASGVDFPLLAYRLATNEALHLPSGYHVGTKFRWLIPWEILHVFAKPSSLASFIRDFKEKNVFYDIDYSDLKPNLFQWLLFFGYARYYKGELRFPHGRPPCVR